MEAEKNIVNSEGQPEQQTEAQVNKIVDDLTLFDDDLMSLVFDENIPATQLILRIILNRHIILCNGPTFVTTRIYL